MQKVKQRTDDELQRAVVHVNYEIDMFKALTSHFQKSQKGIPDDTLQNNAYVESFVLHLRNLIDFLYAPRNPKQPDDMRADDFVKDAVEWNKVRPAKTPLLRDAEMRVDKLAAHLTYARVELSKKWRYPDIYSDLSKVLQRFHDHLASHRQGWFPSLK